ncbi:hypothetical protein ID850_07810 [Xenorhabdus sp. Flor]|nr:hypothetical protein [Xenorhabdus sp. Flor]MBD2814669.1 hypothetical protein [Xenorhabdus sp. Flor]
MAKAATKKTKAKKELKKHYGYEKRVAEGSTIKGKAMFVCANREIAWEFYKQLKAIRPA